ncbi:MAG TPA: hypothetical protein VGX16_07760 [Solirubrobacteraceae bacterium]|nr:hypothetical protein [Solirubrobacteraceae bacterium]
MEAIWIALVVLAGICAILLALELARRLLARDRSLRGTTIANLRDSTSVGEDGAVRSVQAADLYLREDLMEELWSPANLERLARSYWRFLTRATLGLVRVRYGERERDVILVFKFLRLLSFREPEYELDERRGVVRWRVERGLLVARAGRHGQGHLQIEIRRPPREGVDESSADPRRLSQVHIEVEVANFYPTIADRLSRWIYNETQSRIHVIVTHGFLRSLARLDLPECRVGRPLAREPSPAPKR